MHFRTFPCGPLLLGDTSVWFQSEVLVQRERAFGVQMPINAFPRDSFQFGADVHFQRGDEVSV